MSLLNHPPRKIQDGTKPSGTESVRLLGSSNLETPSSSDDGAVENDIITRRFQPQTRNSLIVQDATQAQAECETSASTGIQVLFADPPKQPVAVANPSDCVPASDLQNDQIKGVGSGLNEHSDILSTSGPAGRGALSYSTFLNSQIESPSPQNSTPTRQLSGNAFARSAPHPILPTSTTGNTFVQSASHSIQGPALTTTPILPSTNTQSMPNQRPIFSNGTHNAAPSSYLSYSQSIPARAYSSLAQNFIGSAQTITPNFQLNSTSSGPNVAAPLRKMSKRSANPSADAFVAIDPFHPSISQSVKNTQHSDDLTFDDIPVPSGSSNDIGRFIPAASQSYGITSAPSQYPYSSQSSSQIPAAVSSSQTYQTDSAYPVSQQMSHTAGSQYQRPQAFTLHTQTPAYQHSQASQTSVHPANQAHLLPNHSNLKFQNSHAAIPVYQPIRPSQNTARPISQGAQPIPQAPVSIPLYSDGLTSYPPGPYRTYQPTFHSNAALPVHQSSQHVGHPLNPPQVQHESFPIQANPPQSHSSQQPPHDNCDTLPTSLPHPWGASNHANNGNWVPQQSTGILGAEPLQGNPDPSNINSWTDNTYPYDPYEGYQPYRPLPNVNGNEGASQTNVSPIHGINGNIGHQPDPNERYDDVYPYSGLEYAPPQPTVHFEPEGINATSYGNHNTWTYVQAFLVKTLPGQVVARIFEEADLGLPEIKKMALETASEGKSKAYALHRGFEPPVVPPEYENLKVTWEAFIDSVMREWKTFNLISVLLLSAILTILQISSAAADPLTRYSALFSLICALISLLYGCMYIVRFGSMRQTYKAAEWALEAKRTKTTIWWNVWILLAMPAIWLAWSIILYILCIMSFVWRTGASNNQDGLPLSPRAALAVRLLMTLLLVIGAVYGFLIGTAFKRYGSAMDKAWKKRINGWLEEKPYTLYKPAAASTTPESSQPNEPWNARYAMNGPDYGGIQPNGIWPYIPSQSQPPRPPSPTVQLPEYRQNGYKFFSDSKAPGNRDHTDQYRPSTSVFATRNSPRLEAWNLADRTSQDGGVNMDKKSVDDSIPPPPLPPRPWLQPPPSTIEVIPEVSKLLYPQSVVSSTSSVSPYLTHRETLVRFRDPTSSSAGGSTQSLVRNSNEDDMAISGRLGDPTSANDSQDDNFGNEERALLLQQSVKSP